MSSNPYEPPREYESQGTRRIPWGFVIELFIGVITWIGAPASLSLAVCAVTFEPPIVCFVVCCLAAMTVTIAVAIEQSVLHCHWCLVWIWVTVFFAT